MFNCFPLLMLIVDAPYYYTIYSGYSGTIALQKEIIEQQPSTSRQALLHENQRLIAEFWQLQQQLMAMNNANAQEPKKMSEITARVSEIKKQLVIVDQLIAAVDQTTHEIASNQPEK